MSAPLQPITIRGRYLWQGQKRFIVRGVVYQDNALDRQPYDPITDEELPRLRHDVALFKELGVNTILVYKIESSKPHAQAMKLLEDAGIYVLTQAYPLLRGINRFDPYGSYNAENVQSYFRTIDLMASFPNTLGAFVANRLINSSMSDEASRDCTLVIAAVVRDVKKYMHLKNQTRGQRILPIAYGADNDGSRDRQIFEYLRTREQSERIDFWTFTKYTWNTTFSTSQTESSNDLTTPFTHANIPIFLSEYSSKFPSPPPTEPVQTPNAPPSHSSSSATKTLLTSPTTTHLSGGCLYEFNHSSNNYGLIRLLPNTPGFPPGFQGSNLETERQNAVEQRETELGIVLIMQELVDYRETLKDLREHEESDVEEAEMSDRSNVAEEREEGIGGPRPSGVTSPTTPHAIMPEQGESSSFRITGEVPESCIDWEEERARMESDE
ncbi:unnamed protein product [Cercospora beticola]|nr:unnamed protein product [Cercospora beticola]